MFLDVVIASVLSIWKSHVLGTINWYTFVENPKIFSSWKISDEGLILLSLVYFLLKWSQALFLWSPGILLDNVSKQGFFGDFGLGFFCLWVDLFRRLWYTPQARLELSILLPLAPECWDWLQTYATMPDSLGFFLQKLLSSRLVLYLCTFLQSLSRIYLYVYGCAESIAGFTHGCELSSLWVLGPELTSSAGEACSLTEFSLQPLPFLFWYYLLCYLLLVFFRFNP